MVLEPGATSRFRPADFLSISGLVETFERTWNAADSEGLTALFADDADFTHINGMRATGRRDIARTLQMLLQTSLRGSAVRVRIARIRFLDDEIAVVSLAQSLRINDPAFVRDHASSPSMVLRRSETCWQIEALQNTLVQDPIV